MVDWIIIVDDDAAILESAGSILTKAGKRVTSLHSGKELLEYVRENSFPDMILMAINMPGLNGFETLHILKKEMTPGKEVPVIFLTDDERQALEKDGQESGAMDFIQKPFDPEVLVNRVQRSLDIQNRLRDYAREAETDPLTGFLNKTAAEAKISDICQKDSGLFCALDLDAFKSINDIFGHDIGDRILIMFARVLSGNLEKYDAVYGRIGGDEFIAFVRNMSTEDDLIRFTKKLNADFVTEAQKIIGDHLPLPIGISVGAVAVPEYGRDYDKLFHLADQALYFVKQNGKHGCKLYSHAGTRVKDIHHYLDLETITAILEERNASPNAMWMGNEVFGSIYRYMVRYMDRYHSIAYRVLFTVRTADDISDIENTEIMVQFRKLMQNSLRNSDVMMECGENQLFLLLPEIQEYDIDPVISRLLRNWNNSEYASKAEVLFEAGQVHQKKYQEPEQVQETMVQQVFVADGDEDVLKTVVRSLSGQKTEVTGLRSGDELLDLMKTKRPDLILLDVSLPETDGFETLLRMRRIYDPEREIPVIFLAADETREIESRSVQLGAMDLIRKPIVPEILSLRVKHTLELVQLKWNMSEAVRRKVHEQEKMALHVVQTLAETIDAKDKYADGHSTRVADYAREIGRRHGYTIKQQDEIYMMGLLHDIGRVQLPDEIINKPGKLTEEEFETVKSHTVIGANILGKIEEQPSLYAGARWHHERFDGKGYPDGLIGLEIPEECRILAVADAYDAMTSRRSYRDALPQSAAREEIRKNSGTQFDSKFAEIMLGMIDEDSEFRMREKTE